jgi:hypothetical protein
MSSNYPPGAEHDPNAPWNEPELRFCPYCQQQEINEYESEHDINAFDEGLVSLCRECYAQDIADQMRDEY